MADKEKMEWMYQGTKSLVNREDYLLGKRIDKNFELYSDVVVKDRDEREDIFDKKKSAPKPSASSTEGLPALVARQEDPLAAIRFAEVKRQREMIDNPAFKYKAEVLLRKEFEKAKRKAEKKEAKKKRKEERKKRRDSSSDGDSDEESSRKHNKSLERSSRRHSPERNRKDDSDEGSSRKHHKSPKRSPERKHHKSPERSFRRHNPERSPKRGFRRHSPARSAHRHRSRSYSPPAKRHDRRDNQKTSSSREEEMARGLREMQENAKWKERVKQDNADFARKELEKDAAATETSTRNVAFINAIKKRNEATTVADKIQKSRHRLKIDRTDDSD